MGLHLAGRSCFGEAYLHATAGLTMIHEHWGSDRNKTRMKLPSSTHSCYRNSKVAIALAQMNRKIAPRETSSSSSDSPLGSCGGPYVVPRLMRQCTSTSVRHVSFESRGFIGRMWHPNGIWMPRGSFRRLVRVLAGRHSPMADHLRDEQLPFGLSARKRWRDNESSGCPGALSPAYVIPTANQASAAFHLFGAEAT